MHTFAMHTRSTLASAQPHTPFLTSRQQLQLEHTLGAAACMLAVGGQAAAPDVHHTQNLNYKAPNMQLKNLHHKHVKVHNLL